MPSRETRVTKGRDEKVDRRSKNSWGRRKEKNVKSEYKVPPKEDKSVEEIMHDLQMAALDEVD